MNGITYRFLESLEYLVNAFLFYFGGWLPRLISERTKESQNVLIAKFDSIGDFVLFTASLPAYRELFKNAKLILLVSSQVSDLAVGSPYVDEVWSLDKRAFRRNPLRRLSWFRKMLKGNFAIAVNAVYSTDFNFLECLIGWTRAPRRVAHNHPVEPGSPRRTKLFYTELAEPVGNWKFEIDRNNDLLIHLGYPGPASHKMVLSLNDRDRSVSRQLTRAIQSPYAVLAPGAGSALRAWPKEKFLDTIKRIHPSKPVQWIMVGSAGDGDRSEWLAQELGRGGIRALDLTGKTSLRDAACILEAADFCLANETGPAHIAIALGTPTVCILGGGQFGRFMPYGDPVRHKFVYNPMECFMCNWQCIYPEVRCITEINVDRVVEAVSEVLRLPSDNPGSQKSPNLRSVG